jgi:very-short-patch-repair endonuclease
MFKPRVDGEIAATAREQHALIAFRQLRAIGLSAKPIRRLVVAGALERAPPNVFRVAGAPLTTEQRPAAAVLWGGPSAVEVRVARLLRESGLPKPRRQLVVVSDGRRYRLDFAWPEFLVALECDGKKWHDFERDRRRWSAISAATGYRIVWATWARVRDEPDRLVEEIKQQVSRRAVPAACHDRDAASAWG